MEYDWRTRFGLPLQAVGTPLMGIGEAVRLLGRLLDDPSSATGAAAAGLTEPASLEARVLADLWDLVMGAAAGKKATAYKRPWTAKPKRAARRIKPDTRLSKDDFHARWAQLTTTRG